MLEKEKTVTITAKEAPYAPEEQLGEYTVRRWSWYEKQVCMTRATTIIDASKGLTNTPMPLFNTHMLIMCLKESPLNLPDDPNEAVEVMKALDVDVGDTLFRIAQSINMVTPEEKEDF